jgi:hypothetical protein
MTTLGRALGQDRRRQLAAPGWTATWINKKKEKKVSNDSMEA